MFAAEHPWIDLAIQHPALTAPAAGLLVAAAVLVTIATCGVAAVAAGVISASAGVFSSSATFFALNNAQSNVIENNLDVLDVPQLV